MGLIRERGKTLQALEDYVVITCSTAGQVQVSTVNVVAAAAETTVNGRVIDRLGDELMTRYYYAEPFAYLWATRGSTEADRLLSLGVKLQHGDSSGGGDMAEFSTGSRPAVRSFFSSVQTTPMASWSTGPIYGQSIPGFYDLRPAKRFIRVTAQPKKNRVTTESSGDESFHVGGGLSFRGADELPDIANSTGVGSTSTTT